MKTLLSLLLLTAPLATFGDAPPMMQGGEPSQLIIHNRILATVNGKTISVVDIVKKMDVFLSRYYPQAMNSKMSRYQFYMTNWRDQLNQMIDTELMLVDAEEREVKVTDGEVRETIQERFGPNVMGSLDKLGISYDEARQMIHSEMIVQRMNWLRVHSKALQNVNPKDVKAAYLEFCAKNPPKEEWKYRVLSIRSEDRGLGTKIADLAYDLLQNQKMELQAAVEKLKVEAGSPSLTITVSQDYQVDTKSLSQSHLDILSHMLPGMFSKPSTQMSRAENSMVHRIFYLEERTKTEVPTFEKMANEIKEGLLQKEASKEQMLYSAKLRKRFGYDQKHLIDLVPSDFEPFVLSY